MAQPLALHLFHVTDRPAAKPVPAPRVSTMDDFRDALRTARQSAGRASRSDDPSSIPAANDDARSKSNDLVNKSKRSWDVKEPIAQSPLDKQSQSEESSLPLPVDESSHEAIDEHATDGNELNPSIALPPPTAIVPIQIERIEPVTNFQVEQPSDNASANSITQIVDAPAKQTPPNTVAAESTILSHQVQHDLDQIINTRQQVRSTLQVPHENNAVDASRPTAPVIPANDTPPPSESATMASSSVSPIKPQLAPVDTIDDSAELNDSTIETPNGDHHIRHASQTRTDTAVQHTRDREHDPRVARLTSERYPIIADQKPESNNNDAAIRSSNPFITEKIVGATTSQSPLDDTISALARPTMQRVKTSTATSLPNTSQQNIPLSAVQPLPPSTSIAATSPVAPPLDPAAMHYAVEPSPVSMDKLTDVVKTHVADNRWHVSLQLDPPELGRMRLDVSMRDDGLAMRMQVGSEAVRRMAESRLPDLVQALGDQDLRVAHTQITVRETGHGSMNDPSAHRDSNAPPSHDQSAGRQQNAFNENRSDSRPQSSDFRTHHRSEPPRTGHSRNNLDGRTLDLVA